MRAGKLSGALIGHSRHSAQTTSKDGKGGVPPARKSSGPGELDPGRETDGESAAGSLCSFLTLQFVPDVVGPFLDLSRELLQVILGFWINKCRQSQLEETESLVSYNNQQRRWGDFSGAHCPEQYVSWWALKKSVIRITESLFLKGIFFLASYSRTTE